MESVNHTMTDLFDQLGLPSQPKHIAEFVARRRPLPLEIRLYDADFWTPAQAAFIKDKLSEDGDWALVIDSLNASLRSRPRGAATVGDNDG